MRSLIMIVLFIIAMIMAAIFYQYEILLFIFMAALSLGVLAIGKWKRTKYFLTGMITGGTCEIIGIYLGGWSYSIANYMLVPLWIPIVWGLVLVLLEEALFTGIPVVFSKKAVALLYGSAIVMGAVSSNELLLLLLYATVTPLLFLIGFYKPSEFKMGIVVAVLGTAAEAFSIMEGSLQYGAAALGTPLWVPLCWLNGILVMRRIAMM
jgi:hypothetical protein